MIDYGGSFRFPKFDVEALGNLAFHVEDPDRVYRASYDWTVYTDDQLAWAESYWDRFVDQFRNLLPDRMRSPGSDLRGVNLGTFNGVYQKAWMRAGYDMFGVELFDVVDELHAYGCEGVRGNFMHMPHVASEQFDFAVIDRALCNNPATLFFERADDCPPEFRRPHLGSPTAPRSQDSPTWTTDHEDNEFQVPPWFDEPFRILRPGGAILLILYPYYTDHMLRELATHGHMTVWAVEKRRPYLAVLVDTSKPPSTYVDRSVSIAKVQGAADRTPLQVLSEDPFAYGVRQTAEGHARFLHLLDNHVVTLASDGTVVADDYWAVSGDSVEHFRAEVAIDSHGPDHGRPAAFFLDQWLYRRRGAMDKAAEHRSLWPRPRPKSVEDARAVLRSGTVPRGTPVIFGLLEFDSELNPRSGGVRLPSDGYEIALRRLVKDCEGNGSPLVLATPPSWRRLPAVAAHLRVLEDVATSESVPLRMINIADSETADGLPTRRAVRRALTELAGGPS